MLLAVSVFAWRQNIAECPEIVVGKDSVGNDIYAKLLKLDVEVENFVDTDEKISISLDKDLSLIIFSTRRELAIYNYATGELITKFKMPQNAELETVYSGGFLIRIFQPKLLSGKFITQFYNFNGEKKFEAENFPFFLSSKQDVLIFVSDPVPGVHPVVWVGFNIKTGRKLWEKSIKSKYHVMFSCNHSLSNSMDSEKMYIIADSLVCLDYITGLTTSHPFNSGKSAIFRSALGLDYRPDVLYDHNLSNENDLSACLSNTLTGFHSNWIEKGDTLFIADADNLYAFNTELKPYWTTPLPKKMGSKSSIRLVGDKILLFNYGVGFNNNNILSQGKPFAMSFSIKDGEPVATTIPSANDHMISGLYTDSGRIYWLTRRNLFYCDEGENKLHKIDWKSKAKYHSYDNNIRYAIQDTVWFENNNRIEPIVTDGRQVVIADWGKYVHLLQPDGSEQIIPSERVYVQQPDQDSFNYHLSLNDTKYVRFNENGLSREEYIIIDSIDHKISHRIFSPAPLVHDKDILLVALEDGVAFINLNNSSAKRD